jgi:hypothetical protein
MSRTIARPSPLPPPAALRPRRKRPQSGSRSSSAMPGAVVLDLDPRTALAQRAAHRDARAGAGMFDRVVDQVAEQLVQQRRAARDPRRGEVEAVVLPRGERGLQPLVGRLGGVRERTSAAAT